MTSTEALILWQSHRWLSPHLANRRVRRSGNRSDYDDLKQSGDVSLYLAAYSWDKSLGRFYSYAYKCVLGGILQEESRISFLGGRAAKARRRGRDVPTRRYRSWANNDTKESDGDPFELPPDPLAARELVDQLLKRVPAVTERECVRLAFLENLTIPQIAERLGLSEGQIERARPAGLRRMRVAAASMGLFDD